MTPWSRRCEKNLGAARSADVDALDRVDPAVAQDSLRGGPEIEVAPAHRARAEASSIRMGDVAADLVAARPDAGTDHGGKARVAQGGDPGLEDSLEQAEPAGVQQRKRRLAVLTNHRHREAVSRQLQHRNAGKVGPQPVALPAPLAHLGAVHGCGMNLAIHREALGVGPGGLAQPAAVLCDVFRRVVGEQPQVQGLVRSLADAAMPGRKRDLVRTGSIPAEHRHGHRGSAAARSSRAWRVFNTGSSTTASSSASSARPSAGPSA